MTNTRAIQRALAVVVFVLGLSLAIAAVMVLSQMGSRSPGQLVHDRAFGHAHVLSDGKVLLVGGIMVYNDVAPTLFSKVSNLLILNFGVHRRGTFSGLSISSKHDYELFDPISNTWSVVKNDEFVLHSLSLGHDNILMVDYPNKVNIYHATTNTSESCDPSPYDLFFTDAVTLSSGKVLLVVNDRNNRSLATSIEFDPFQRKFDLGSARKLGKIDFVGHLQCLKDGHVLMFHRLTAVSPTAASKIESYDPKDKQWSHLGQLDENSYNIILMLPNKLDLIIYGSTGDCELLNPTNGALTKCSGTVPAKLDAAHFPIDHAVLLKDGRVLHINDPCQIYDPLKDKWSQTGALHQLKAGATVKLLENGKVLIAGGFANNKSLTTCELYDPATGEWTEL